MDDSRWVRHLSSSRSGRPSRPVCCSLGTLVQRVFLTERRGPGGLPPDLASCSFLTTERREHTCLPLLSTCHIHLTPFYTPPMSQSPVIATCAASGWTGGGGSCLGGAEGSNTTGAWRWQVYESPRERALVITFFRPQLPTIVNRLDWTV